MSLEGNLTAFGLSEILQLIAVQQKSGMLSISRQDGSMKLFFREGKIISTRDRRRGARDPIKDYLTRYGIITRTELQRLTDIAEKSKLDVTEVIVSENLLDEEAMRTHYRNHIQETVHDILTWEQCSYKFLPGKDIINGIKTWGEFNIEGLLMESMRRIDEYPQILDGFPDGTASVKSRSESAEPDDLSGNEAAVLSLLSETRTIDDLVAHAKLPRFETYETLKHLKEKDLIEVAESRTAETVAAKGSRRKRRRGPLISKNPLPLIVSLALLAAAGFWNSRSVFPFVKADVGAALVDAPDASAPTIDRNQVEEELRWFLEVYKAMHGSYPSDIAKLESAGVVPGSFILDVRRYAFRYYLTPDGARFTLL
ncbi:MAG: DUF4388 domain-containing protein [bacterium]